MFFWVIVNSSEEVVTIMWSGLSYLKFDFE